MAEMPTDIIRIATKIADRYQGGKAAVYLAKEIADAIRAERGRGDEIEKKCNELWHRLVEVEEDLGIASAKH